MINYQSQQYSLNSLTEAKKTQMYSSYLFKDALLLCLIITSGKLKSSAGWNKTQYGQ